MNSKTSLTMADLGFVSVARYLQYVAVSAELEDTNQTAIFSFCVTPRGAKHLITQKEIQLNRLEGNQRKIRNWVRDADLPLDSKELVMLRSLYAQNREYIGLLNRHIATANELDGYQQRSLFDAIAGREGIEDELPF